MLNKIMIKYKCNQIVIIDVLFVIIIYIQFQYKQEVQMKLLLYFVIAVIKNVKCITNKLKNINENIKKYK